VGKRERNTETESTASSNKPKSKKADTRANASSSSGAASSSSSSGGSGRPSVGGAGDSASTGPRVEVINGRIVVKESSLLLNTVPTAGEDEYEEIVEGVHATATYSSFLKRRPSPAWGIEETRLFYSALRQTGLEFTMLQAFFPGRTRMQLKRKYMREQQQHPELIELALNTSLPLDLTPFEAQHGDLSSNASSGPVSSSGSQKQQQLLPSVNASNSAATSPELDPETIEV
jgi:hypothetical protein